MRALRLLPDAIIVLLIVALGALDAALYGGVIHRPERARAELSVDRMAELDDSDELPGRYVPPQHRRHTADYPLPVRVEFCGEVVHDGCYASNPPTSGLHIGVMRGVRLADGNVVDLPPPPGVYDFVIPREAIPHIQEHAGVYIGHNCATAGCRDAVAGAERAVERELALGARVVMSPDPDLDEDTIALASWTRIDSFDAEDYDDDRLRDFVRAHSCRFDPEAFCRPAGRQARGR